MPPMSHPLNPKRTVAELKELRALTSDDHGAQRVAFTETWLKARGWLRQKVVGLPLEIHDDAAGNTWFTLRGESLRGGMTSRGYSAKAGDKMLNISTFWMPNGKIEQYIVTGRD